MVAQKPAEGMFVATDRGYMVPYKIQVPEIEEERLRIEREKRLELRPKVEDEYESGSDQNSAPNSDAA